MDDAMPGMTSHLAAGAPPPKPLALPTPVKSAIPIRMTAALDRHPVVAEILADRAAAIARDPARDVLVLVAHGPEDNRENAEWLADMAALANQIAAHKSYARIECVTLRDDADAPVRDRATAELRKKTQAADDAGYHVLVVPLLLSYGGIENGLRQRLDGIEHTLSPQALLPDPRVAQWVLESAREMHAQRYRGSEPYRAVRSGKPGKWKDESAGFQVFREVECGANAAGSGPMFGNWAVQLVRVENDGGTTTVTVGLESGEQKTVTV